MKLLVFVLIVSSVIYMTDKEISCNKKGSLAAKINWSGKKECK